MKHRFKIIASSAIILIMASCAAPPKKKEEAIFFPPAPELPRIQYLASFTGLKDIEEESSFEKFVRGNKPNLKLDKPYGVGIYDGKIYVCDTNATVIVFDFKTKKFGPLEGAKGQGKLMQPMNISIEEDGTKYVADPVRGQVVVFDKADQYVKAYGLPGNWKPVDAETFEDRLYVVDEMNAVIKVFDKKTGEIVKTIGDKGEDAQKLFMPTNVTFDKDGNLYVSDVGRFQVVKYDRDGHFLSTFGQLGDSLGSFARPRGIAVDRLGNLYAVDAGFNNVQIFSKDGRLLMFFGPRGGPKDPGTLVLPAQVIIDYANLKYFQKYIDPSFEAEHLIIVTNQFGTRLLNVYAMGKEKGKKYPTDEEIKKLLEEKRKQELEKQKAKEGEGKKPENTGEAGKGADLTKPAEAPAVK
jgi:hypothetical protein